MRKTILSLFLALLASVGTIFASDTSVDGIWYNFDNSAMTASVTYRGYEYRDYSNEYSGEVVIPSSITYDGKTYSVTSIGWDAFRWCKDVTTVTIPNSVIEIGSSAFDGCERLTSVTIGNSVTSIGESAFWGCTDLTTISIPNSVISIGAEAFFQCFGLTSVTIGNSVSEIGESAFGVCSNLTSVTLPNSVTSVGNRAFSGCRSLTSPVYNVHVFAYMPQSFSGEYIIPEGIESIVGGAFSGCTSLTLVTIPESVSSIGENAFYDVSQIIYLGSAAGAPWGAKRVIDNLLSELINNYTINVLWSKNEGQITLKNEESVITITATPIDGGIFEKWSDGNTDNPRKVILTQDTTFVAEFAYIITPTEAAKIASSLSSNQTTNSYYLIRGTVSEVTDVNSEYGNATFYLSDGTTNFYCYRVHYLFGQSFSSNSQIQVGDVVTISAQIKKHGYSTLEASFGYLTYTNRISMFNIGNYAFRKLNSNNVSIFYAGRKENLKQVNIPDHVSYQDADYTVTLVDESGFYGCTNLTEVVISDNISVIGNIAFEGCTNLRKVTIGKNVKTFLGDGNHCFWDCSKIDTVIWNAIHCDDMDYSPFYSARENMKEIRISNDIEWIPANLCWGMGYLKTLDIPASVMGIGKDAFNGCINLETVNIPHKVESIGKSAFKGCTSLKTLSLGANISTYSDSVFYNCTNLAFIYNFREKPARLSKGAFGNVDYFNCTLYVLSNSLDMYKSSGSDWTDFYYIEPIGAQAVTTETVQVTPYSNSANIIWPIVTGAASYELIISDKDGKEICSLIFNEKGQLTAITFKAPVHHDTSQQISEQVTGFSFTITGLDHGSKYSYAINAKNAQGKTLKNYRGVFYTEGYEGDSGEAIDEISVNSQLSTVKFFRNGQLFILRDGKMYNAQGARVE